MAKRDDPIEVWWTAFEAKADKIDSSFSNRGESDWDLPKWMFETLGRIHPQLMWEYGPAVEKNGHRLVITPEWRRDLRPLVNSILRRAPELDRWEFYAYRLAEDYEHALMAVQSRTGGDVSNTYFRTSIDDFNLIDLEFLSRDYTAETDAARNDVFVATESLLGEEALDMRIGAIEVAHLDLAQENEVTHIEHLKEHVDRLLAEIDASLPNEPYHRLKDNDEWTLFELKPQEADDYPGQKDMFVGKSRICELWQNAHSSVSFVSRRFSKCGETFCYVKIDGTEGVDEERFEDKGEIEDALDDALRAADVGCFVGGGTGWKYSYVDLALTDIEKGAAIVKDVLRRGNIPKRTWILFYDTDLQARWIGIWDDTPPPPLPDFESSD